MRKFLIGMLLCVLFLAFVIPEGMASASGMSTNRLSGKDRFQVAVNVAEKEGWGSGGTIILTNYLAFADALSASPYAYKLNAPILLTTKNSLTTTTKKEIQKLGAAKIVIVGGPASVSNQVITELQSIGISKANIKRIGGQNRFQVAANVAAQIQNYDHAVVADGKVFSDSLAIAPYAAKHGYPILLTMPNNVPSATQKALNGHGQPLVIGGPNSVGKNVYQSIHAYKRIGGADRYEVAANIISQLGMSTNRVYISTGTKFADALTGSVLAAKNNEPLLLTLPKRIPEALRSIINKKNITNFTVLGGTASVSNQVASDLVSPLLGKTIVVDPGHGGGDPGAKYNGVSEKNLNLQFATKLTQDLKALGANVLMTRTTDKYYSLQYRTDFANSHHADLFISIHQNAGSSTNSGLGVYYSSYHPDIGTNGVVVTFNRSYPYNHRGTTYKWLKELTDQHRFEYLDNGTVKSYRYDITNCAWAFDTTPSQAAKTSKALATNIVSAFKNTKIGINGSRGTFDQDLYVTRHTKMPSILVEMGFMTNYKELQLLKSPTVQSQRAEKLAHVIFNFYK